jgi:hypothetical protein
VLRQPVVLPRHFSDSVKGEVIQMQSNVKGSVAAVSDRADNDYFNIALDDAELDDNWYIGDGSITDYVDGLRQGQQVVLEFNNESVNEIRKVNGDASQGVDDDSGAESLGGNGVSSSQQSFSVSKQERIKYQTAFKKAVDQVDRRSCETKEDYRKMVKELTVLHGKVLDEVMME